MFPPDSRLDDRQVPRRRVDATGELRSIRRGVACEGERRAVAAAEFDDATRHEHLRGRKIFVRRHDRLDGTGDLGFEGGRPEAEGGDIDHGVAALPARAGVRMRRTEQDVAAVVAIAVTLLQAAHDLFEHGLEHQTDVERHVHDPDTRSRVLEAKARAY